MVFITVQNLIGIDIMQVFTARRYARAVYAVVVCLSVRPTVRPSVTCRYFTKTAKHRIMKITPYHSPVTLVF